MAADENMTAVAIVTRRLREGKTYDDFRQAWDPKTGFGAPSRFYTVVSAADPRDVTIIGFIRSSVPAFAAAAEIDIAERFGPALDDIVEPATSRSFGLVIAEDDFSATGPVPQGAPTIDGEETVLDTASRRLRELADVVAHAATMRERTRKD